VKVTKEAKIGFFSNDFNVTSSHKVLSIFQSSILNELVGIIVELIAHNNCLALCSYYWLGQHVHFQYKYMHIVKHF
jgi:hypothetical protein